MLITVSRRRERPVGTDNSKRSTGQKLIRDCVERSFPEFIARVPAGLLNEHGLKRHYKLPETVKILRIAAKNGGGA
jgi:hypothetical protein